MDNTSNEKVCSNCGTPNNQDSIFCINCGNSFNTTNDNQVVSEPVIEKPVVNETPVVTTEAQSVSVIPEPPKKKKKGKGCLIALIVILLIAGLIVGGIFLFKKLTFFEDPFVDEEVVSINYADAVKADDITNTALEQIGEDYRAGILTDDQYILQIAYLLYEPTKLDTKYSSLEHDYIDPNYLLSEIEPIGKKLSKDTIYYIYQEMSLPNIQIDLGEETSNALKSVSYDNRIRSVNTDPKAVVYLLSEVKLSSDGNFLLYYSTKGSNAVTDEFADEIMGMLENTVKEYEKQYKLKYQYSSKTPTLIRPNTRLPFEKLLEKNNIDTKYLDTAMPVYLINTSNTDILGFYTAIPDILIELLGDIGATVPIGNEQDNISFGTFYTTYTYPFFIANSATTEPDNMKIIIAHELFHHYQKYICGDGEYGTCSKDKVITEATAQLGAVHTSGVNATGTALNKWAKEYVLDCSTSLEEVYDGAGYPIYPFVYNYEQIVYNGSKKIFKSISRDDYLEYLYKHSGGKYKKVMTTTAEKFLTLDYDNKVLIATNPGGNNPVYPHDNWSKKEKNNTVGGSLYYNETTMNINHSSMHFTYINPKKYENSDGKIAELKVSSTIDDLTIIFFVKQNDRYQKVFSQDLDKEFVLNINEWKDYDELALAIVDSSIEGSNRYKMSIIQTDNTKPTINPDKVKDKIVIKKSRIVCSQVEDLDYIKSTYQVMVEFGHNDDIKDLYVKGTVEMEDNAIFKIAKGVTTGAVFLLKQKYKEEFGKITLRTYDEGNKYIILGRVKKDIDTAARNSFGTNDLTREGVFKAIEDKGFTCEYK